MQAQLAHRVVREARIQAFDRPLTHFHGGLVLSDGSDDRLRQRRGNKPVDRHDSGAEFTSRMSGEFIYGGPIHKKFGHVMAEMVHRIVPSKLLHAGAPWIFVTVAGARGTDTIEWLPGFARDVFDLLGVDKRDVHLVERNTIVEELFVAEQGSELRLGPKPGYLDDLAEYVSPRLDELHRGVARPRKLYVSRSRMPGGFFLGERYLEAQLEAEGFTVLYPECHSITVQMDHYRKADVVVFVEGSACHGVELLGTGSLGRTYLLVRRERLSGNFERILRPRAAEFGASYGHTLIGTKFLNSVATEPNERLGVLVFDVEELVSFFRANDIAKLPGFSEQDYWSAAEADLARYLKGDAADVDTAPERRKGLGLIPGAHHELNEAFRRHVGTTRPSRRAAGSP